MRTLSFLFLLFSFQIINAQQTPTKAQSESILLLGAKAHLGNGEVYEKSAIGFKNGKITFVVDISKQETVPTGYDKVIKLHGKEVYPGLIAMDSYLGLVEIEAVRSTVDYKEVGDFNPSVRSIIAYNTDSKIIPTIRSNGILLAQISPRAGRWVMGQSSVVQLDAWNWEDAAYKTDEGIHLNWPSSYKKSGWWAAPGSISKRKGYSGEVEKIKSFFQSAKAYANKNQHETKNLKFEAMRGLWSGEKHLYIHANRTKSITEAVLFAKAQGVQPIIIGGQDSWKMTDFLKENKVWVILQQSHSLPMLDHDDYDQAFKTAAQLHEAGIPFCFKMDGSWQQRNIAFQAGQAVAYGLPYEAAIQALTKNAAMILGIDKQTGSIEMGKDANIIVVEGDVLDMRSAQVLQAFIQGRAIDLNNKQKALAEKFRAKY